MTSGIPSMNPISYSSLVSSGNKVYVPVESNEVIYTQFDHVSGYAVRGSENNGVSVSKIKILNTLIDQLVSLQTNKTKPEMLTDLSDEQVNSLIKDYQNKIEIALSQAKNNPFAFGGASGLPTGIVLNASV